MDKILEALVSSSHSVPVKKAIVKKVVEAAEKEVTAEQCQALYTLTTRLIFLGEDAFQKQVGFQVLEAYARYHRADFELFFSKDFVLGLLQQGYGPLDRKDPAVVDYIHGCLRLLISCPSVLDIFSIIQTEILRMVCERPEPALCARLATMLSDFIQCIPREKTAILFCQQLVRTIGYFHCPASQERELREYVDQVTKVSTLLQNIWKAEPVTLLPSLQEVFAIISSTDPSFEPSIALASLVQHIPLQMITVLIKSLTTDQNVKDTSMTQALCRMIDWLSWPLAHHVEMWVIALLKGLAAVQKFTILIDVTLLKIELVVPHIVDLVQSLKHDGLPTSKAFLLHFTELVHCMMYQYSGFPDLYDDILEAIKELPGPGEEKIKLVLNQSAWTSQSNSFASGLLRLPGKSETGKTGLINLGNTCYMNSIIQTLFSATDFRRLVLSLRLNDATANTLMKKLQLLFTFLSHTQRAAYAPRVFFEASRPPWFNAGSQQDCSEYLRFLLDRLHEEEKTIQVLMSAKPNVVSPGNGPSNDTGGETSAEDAGVSPVAPVEGKSEGNDERTLIERMFGGRLSTGIRCMTCNSVSEKEEPFTDLSLAFCPSSTSSPLQTEGPSEEPRGPCQGAVNGGSEAPEIGPSPKPVTASTTGVHFVPGSSEPPLSVPDLVDYFLAPEILDKENAYFCQKCGSLQRAERGMRVVVAPEYLILTLLRFSYDAKCHVRRKILDNVTIPPLMRLPVHAPPPKHSSSSSSPPSSPLQVDSPESSENLAKKLKPSQREEEETGLEGDNGMAGGESEVGVWPAARFLPYVLSSVVMHSGMSSESGHYYSYGRNLNGADGAQHHLANPLALGEDPGNGQTEPIAHTCSGSTHPKQEVEEVCGGQAAGDWLLFNDSRVTFTSLGSVQNVTNRFPKDTAYVLIYRKQDVTGGQNSTGGVTANGMRLGSEPPLQKELMDAVTKDNKLFLQEQELNARTRALQAASASCSFRPNGPDDNEPPGSCGPSGGGGGGGGFNTVNRLVF
uniref:Ubiquitin specific peptidase 38 n=1 Tax=Oncorhynchus kisutch TaxID=8019 RepID=A0A8C7CUM0_ONCKI